MTLVILGCSKLDQNSEVQQMAESSSNFLNDWGVVEDAFPIDPEWEAYQDSLADSRPFTSVSIPQPYQSSQTNGDTVVLGVRVLDDEENVMVGLIKFVINEDDPGKLVSLAISNDVFDQTSLTATFWVDHHAVVPSIDGETLPDCLTGCEARRLTKLCQAFCWGKAGVEIISPILGFVLLL